MNQVTWQLDFIGAKGCNSHLLLPKERLNLLKTNFEFIRNCDRLEMI